MATVNVPGIGHIQRVGGNFLHEGNIFHPIKGPIVINCSSIIFHLTDMLIIDHYLKRDKKIRHTTPSKYCEGMDCSLVW